ncbi:MAG TPA: CVNH domain-containing protein [Acetobacteraceae bacterium]
MRLSRSRPFQRTKGAIALHALASALLVTSGSLASAAGAAAPQASPVLQVQYRQDGYGQDQYRQPPPGYDDQRGQDPYRQPPRGYGDQQDRYGQDRRRQDDQGDRSRQGGDGRAGSYQQSCSGIRQNGSTLTAVCGDGRGRRMETSIDVNRCGRSDIGNSRGFLQCGNIRGSGRQVD